MRPLTRPARPLRVRRLPGRPLAALALGTALLAGCGGSGGGGGGSTEQAQDLDELLQASAASTAESGSSKVSVSSTTTVADQEVVFAGEGAFDHDAGTGELSFSVPGADGTAGGGGTIEERIVGDDLYLALPQQPGFYKVALSEVAGTSLGSSTDPTAALQALQGLTDVEEVGEAEVRGATTTHYRGTLDVSQAVEAATGSAKEVLETSLSSAKTVPFEAYLDEEGRLVKLVQTISLAASEATQGNAVESSTVLELFDFGTAVDVTAPPAAEVRDGAPLLAALQGATGGAPAAGGAQPAPSPAS